MEILNNGVEAKQHISLESLGFILDGNITSINIVLEKLWFGKNLIKWVKIPLTNQESCIINGGKTTKYLSWRKEQSKEILYLLIFLY